MSKKRVIALIPARMGSSRFPGKPMKNILGKPMIEIVYNNVSKSKLTNYTYVATCDLIIYNHIISVGGNAIMTSSKHERASDRCAEALKKIEKKHKVKYDIVIMVQGDEPLIKAKNIDKAVKPMINDNKIHVINILGKILNYKEFNDKNCIKVITDYNNNALYFSRSPIPYFSKFINLFPHAGKQICVIPFRRDFLIKYNSMKQTRLEKTESVDMLRVLENGYNVKMIPMNIINQSVDTLSDLKKVERIISK